MTRSLLVVPCVDGRGPKSIFPPSPLYSIVRAELPDFEPDRTLRAAHLRRETLSTPHVRIGARLSHQGRPPAKSHSTGRMLYPRRQPPDAHRCLTSSGRQSSAGRLGSDPPDAVARRPTPLAIRPAISPDRVRPFRARARATATSQATRRSTKAISAKADRLSRRWRR
jgi:hypothetical protein